MIYAITLSGEMGDLLTGLFPEHEVEAAGGRTRIVARLRDEAELMGLLERLYGFRLHLEALQEIGSGAGAGA